MKSYSKACSLLIIYPSVLSPHIREYNTGLDPGFYAVDSGFLVLYYGFQIPGFRSLLHTFTGFSVPQEKTSRIRNPESLIFYMGRSLTAFPFFVTTFIYLLTWFNLCLYCAVSQDIPIICSEVVIRIAFVCFNGAAARAFRSGPHTYRKWKPIHARKFGYDIGVRPLSVHRDSEGMGKETR